jgi:asparagine N-glycosylation enzyme membrane subunit Stt3
MVMAWLFETLAGALGHDSAIVVVIVVVIVGLLLGLAPR